MTTGEKKTPCCRWEDDCQGKKDYDGRLISVSTRYWPRGGGFSELTEDRQWIENEDRPEIKPSATVAIVLNYGDPDDYGYGDSIDLATVDFEGETEEEVKSKVETWVQEQFDAISELVASHYAKAKGHQ